MMARLAVFYLGFPLPGPGLLPARFPYCQTDNFSFEIKLKFLGRNFILKNLFWTWWKSDQDRVGKSQVRCCYVVFRVNISTGNSTLCFNAKNPTGGHLFGNQPPWGELGLPRAIGLRSFTISYPLWHLSDSYPLFCTRTILGHIFSLIWNEQKKLSVRGWR